MQTKKLELYFHIPFCVRKCLYCDFLSAPADEETKHKYMEALLTETVGSAVQYQEYCVDSVFIGGGTPSVADLKDVEALLQAVRKYYNVSPDAEVTMEVNPGTVDAQKLAGYVKAGVNRLSIGMQSANDEELKRLGRIHTWADFVRTFTDARKVGFCNINVDVMSALPGQTLDSFEETLEKVLSLQDAPEHISAYSLIVEEGTPFGVMYEEGRLPIPDEEEDRLMYHRTKEMLKAAGYYRYEISNYAKEGFACRHNQGYWTRKNYVGFGIGAASLVENVRFRNGDDIVTYMQNPTGCRESEEVIDVNGQMEETMFLGLRLTDGVDSVLFHSTYSKTLEDVYGEVIARNITDGLLCWKDPGHKLALTENGLDVSNYVMAQFLL